MLLIDYNKIVKALKDKQPSNTDWVQYSIWSIGVYTVGNVLEEASTDFIKQDFLDTVLTKKDWFK